MTSLEEARDIRAAGEVLFASVFKSNAIHKQGGPGTPDFAEVVPHEKLVHVMVGFPGYFTGPGIEPPPGAKHRAFYAAAGLWRAANDKDGVGKVIFGLAEKLHGSVPFNTHTSFHIDGARILDSFSGTSKARDAAFANVIKILSPAEAMHAIDQMERSKSLPDFINEARTLINDSDDVPPLVSLCLTFIELAGDHNKGKVPNQSDLAKLVMSLPTLGATQRALKMIAGGKKRSPVTQEPYAPTARAVLALSAT